MQETIKDSHRPKSPIEVQEIKGKVEVTNPTPPIIIGDNFDTAVEGDAAGSLSAKIRGLNKTITDLNTNIENLIDNYQNPMFSLLRGILVELKIMNYYQHQTFNMTDDTDKLINDFDREAERLM